MSADALILWTVIHLLVFCVVGVLWILPRFPRVHAGLESRGSEPGNSVESVGIGEVGKKERSSENFGGEVLDSADKPAPSEEQNQGLVPYNVPSAKDLMAKRSLTAGPSFDIRQIDPDSVELSADEMLNPLHSIVQLVEKIREEGDLSANQKRYLGAALAKSRRMIGHIEDIDLMMRLQQGTVSARERSFSLTEKLERLVAAAGRAVADRGISVRHSNQTNNSYLISSDEQLLEKLLGQLMNACLKVVAAGGTVEVKEASTEIERAVSGSEFFFLEEEDLAIQEQRRIEIIFSVPEIAHDDRLSYLTHAVANDPQSAIALRSFGGDGDGKQDVFGLSLARNIARKLGAELLFVPSAGGRTEFRLSFEAECLATSSSKQETDLGRSSFLKH
ncbi:MAG: sensor histidine kinase [Puniceicoccaceae bacterium]